MIDALRAVNNEKDSIRRHLKEIWDEDKLECFFGSEHFCKHRDTLLAGLEECAKLYSISLYFNKESLRSLYTVGTLALKDYILSLLDKHSIRERDRSSHMAYECAITQSSDIDEDPTMDWTLSERENGEEVAYTITRLPLRTATIRESIRVYETMCVATREIIDRFLEDNPALTEHFDAGYFNKRIDEILVWLEESFIFQNVIVYIDDKEPFLLRQLFTQSYLKPRRLLDCFTRHKWFLNPDIYTLPKKRVVKLVCEETPLNSTTLKNIVKNKEICSVVNEYRDLVQEKAAYPSVIIDVGQIWHNDVIEGITLLEKPSYEEIQSVYESRELLNRSIRQLQEENKRTRYIKEKRKVEEDHVKSRVASALASLPQRLIYKGGGDYMIAEDCRANWTDLVIKSSTGLDGFNAGCQIFEDCLDQTVKNANTVTEQYGTEMFRGGIVLSNDLQSLESFDMRKTPKWSFPNKKLLEDEKNKYYIDQYKEKQMMVNLMKLEFGKDEVSRCVVPCIMNHNQFTMNNNIVVNIAQPERMEVEEEAPVKKQLKRKRSSKATTEKLKRVRKPRDPVIIQRVEEPDDHAIPPLPDLILKSTRVYNPDMESIRFCIVCELPKKYPSMLKVNPPHAVTKKVYMYERNICHACIKMQGNLIPK